MNNNIHDGKGATHPPGAAPPIPPCPPGTSPPTLGVPTGTCPLCRRRPADCWAACACEPGKRFAVCGPCLDTMGRSGRGWYYWAWRAGLVTRDEVDELDDEDAGE
jgi:hypothetical protein